MQGVTLVGVALLKARLHWRISAWMSFGDPTDIRRGNIMTKRKISLVPGDHPDMRADHWRISASVNEPLLLTGQFSWAVRNARVLARITSFVSYIFRPLFAMSQGCSNAQLVCLLAAVQSHHVYQMPRISFSSSVCYKFYMRLMHSRQSIFLPYKKSKKKKKNFLKKINFSKKSKF
jgi:hypothetical protein